MKEKKEFAEFRNEILRTTNFGRAPLRSLTKEHNMELVARVQKVETI